MINDVVIRNIQGRSISEDLFYHKRIKMYTCMFREKLWEKFDIIILKVI